MANVKFKWNIAAFQEIRRLPGVVRELNDRAEAAAEAAGDGYIAGSYDGVTRHRASVVTAEFKAIKDNAKNNTLVKALDAARG